MTPPAAPLVAPFPWFGGKRRVGHIVWKAFGDVPNYIEPFAGSLAVLLARPTTPRIETVNDKDCYIANFWRATEHAANEVAQYASAPVNECDLHARHRWLIDQRERVEAMMTDPFAYDARVAGWWCWGISMWIGDAWCAPRAETRTPRQVPSLLGHRGVGTARRKPMNKSRGVHGTTSDVTTWFHALRDRLANVRVVCGDWARVLTPSSIGTTASRDTGMLPAAIFLDPPYSPETGHSVTYAGGDGRVAADVAAWARDHGDDPGLRIALCGYEGEHAMPPTWKTFAWSARGGYGRGEAQVRRHRERIWFSPHCLPFDQAQLGLFQE